MAYILLRKSCITCNRIAVSLMIRMMISEAKDLYWFPAIVVLMPLFETQANNSTQLVWTTLRVANMYEDFFLLLCNCFLRYWKGNVREVIGRYHYRMTLRILLLSLKVDSLGQQLSFHAHNHLKLMEIYHWDGNGQGIT